jgi:hypothetical protein
VKGLVDLVNELEAHKVHFQSITDGVFVSMPSVMNSEDRARYGGVTATANTANMPNMGTTSRKRAADERREQGDFANRRQL